MKITRIETIVLNLPMLVDGATLYTGGGGDGAARATGCRVPATPRRGGDFRDWAFMSLTLPNQILRRTFLAE